MTFEARCQLSVPPEPTGKAIGIPCSSKRPAISGKIEPTLSFPETLKAEVEPVANDLPLDPGRTLQGIVPFNLCTVLRQYEGNTG
jgi:hypothetical protein